MESKKKDYRKYMRRNHFLDNNIEEENSKNNNNYQNSLISKILKKNENLKSLTISDKTNLDNIDNIKNNIKNIFSTDESKLKAMKYIINTRKEKRELSPKNKISNNDLFPKREKMRESTPDKTNNFNAHKNNKDKDENNVKILAYSKRNISPISSDDILLESNEEFNFEHLNRKYLKSFKKYNKRIIKNEDKENKINNNNNNIISHINNSIDDNQINNIKQKAKINNNNINNNIKLIKEEEKNCENISFDEEVNNIQTEKTAKFDSDINDNIKDNINGEDNNKLLMFNSQEISFRSFKNENDYNSNNISLDIKDFKTDNDINKNKLLLKKCSENNFTIFRNKNYKYKFETEDEISNYIQSGNYKINSKPITIIYEGELNKIKKENFDKKNEISKLYNEKELYSNEIIRLQKENELLREKINEIYYAYQEIYNIYNVLKEENEQYKKLKNDFILESNITFNVINIKKMKINDINNNDIIKNKGINEDNILKNKINNSNDNIQINKNENKDKKIKDIKNNEKIIEDKDKKDDKNSNGILSKAMSKFINFFNEKKKKQDESK